MKNFGLTKYSLLCALLLVDRALTLPAPAARSSGASNSQDKRPPKLVEIKLPVKITSMEDLIAWAKNAMRSMASRIDITLASVDEPGDAKREKSKPSPSEAPPKQREPLSLSFETRRPGAPGALLSTFASLISPDSGFDTLVDDENYLRSREDSLYGNVNAYVPLLFEDLDIAKYREEAIKKYYIDQAKRENDENDENERKDKAPVRYAQAVAQQTSNVDVGDAKVKSVSLSSKVNKDAGRPAPVITVPFEAVVTITRESAPEPTRKTFEETRDPPDEFPPYFEKEYPRREAPREPVKEPVKKNKGGTKVPKRQLASLGDLLRALGITRRLTTSKKDTNRIRGTNAAATNSKQRKPAAIFTPPPAPSPIVEFEDDPPQPTRNETSQRQEDYDDDEEEEGSLGSLTDLLPLVIPILEDLSDPESETDLGEVLEAAIPLLEGLSMDNPDDPDTPNILRLIGPILDTILGGRDGQGSDFGALLGPLLQIAGPLIGPLSGPLSAASSGGGGGGSTVASLLQASIGPLAQAGPDGTSPLSNITAKVLTTIIRDLKVGQPGGSDIGALVGSVLTGVVAGTSSGLSGASGDKGAKPYGPPYGAYGPAQAGSVNKRITTGYLVPGQQTNSLPQIIAFDQQSIPVPVNILGHHRIGQQTTRRPYVNVPQRVYPVPQPPPLQNYAHPHIAGPVQAETTNGDSGGSSYLPYGNNGVQAGSVNPLSLVGSSIKDILGGGIGLLSSVINAVFGISGSSSSSKPAPAYGPPHPGYN